MLNLRRKSNQLLPVKCASLGLSYLLYWASRDLSGFSSTSIATIMLMLVMSCRDILSLPWVAKCGGQLLTPINHNIKTTEGWSEWHWSHYSVMFCSVILDPGIHMDVIWPIKPIWTLLQSKIHYGNSSLSFSHPQLAFTVSGFIVVADWCSATVETKDFSCFSALLWFFWILHKVAVKTRNFTTWRLYASASLTKCNYSGGSWRRTAGGFVIV